jgi:sugar/nucleoside kinase (ribokinase family)
VARFTPGCSGADLAAIVNEASIRAARRGAVSITNDDFEDALRNYLGARGVNMSGLAEVASSGINTVPDFIKKTFFGGGMNSPNDPQQSTPLS